MNSHASRVRKPADTLQQVSGVFAVIYPRNHTRVLQVLGEVGKYEFIDGEEDAVCIVADTPAFRKAAQTLVTQAIAGCISPELRSRDDSRFFPTNELVVTFNAVPREHTLRDFVKTYKLDEGKKHKTKNNQYLFPISEGSGFDALELATVITKDRRVKSTKPAFIDVGHIISREALALS